MPSLHRAVRVHLPALAVLVVALSATLLVAWQLGRTVRTKDEERFRNAAERLQEAVQGRIDTYVAMLRAGAALLDVQPDLTRRGFRDFVARLELTAQYPGIQGIGFTRRIPASDLAAFEASRRAAGDLEFSVWPDDSRAEYHAIVFLEPLDRRNLVAIGYDMFTESVRREAMTRARDTGAPAASGPVTLVQEIDGEVQPGFLIYMPVYEGGAVPAPALRDERLVGFVYSPFRAGDLFAGIFGRDRNPRIGFDLYDAAAPEPRLYHSGAADDPWFTTTRQIEIAGRLWTLAIFSLEALEEGSSAGLVPVVRWSGVVMSLLLAALVVLQTQARARLEEQADTLTGLYARLQQLLESERNARGEAERVSRLKDEFLATLSHELRTPLNAIQGWAHLLGLAAVPPAKRTHAVEAILRSANMQARLIEDLLDMSRIVSGRVRLETHDLRLDDVLESSINAVRPAADAKGVGLELRLDAASVVMHGDANRLQQVFGNLLSNAVKFTPSGGRIVVTQRLVPGYVEIEVADTGAGIDPEFLPYVFERFRQGDGSITRRHGGLGLGLSIARSLVAMHSGTITAESAGTGRGATFHVRLPLANERVHASATDPVRGPDLSAVPLPPGVLAGLTVLAVDDDADARELMRDALTAYGGRVTTAADAEQALTLFRADPDRFALLVSDIGMPGMDGYALARAVQQQRNGAMLPAVAVTAYASADDAARAHAAGYVLHVPKPATPHAIAAACAIASGRVTAAPRGEDRAAPPVAPAGSGGASAAGDAGGVSGAAPPAPSRNRY